MLRSPLILLAATGAALLLAPPAAAQDVVAFRGAVIHTAAGEPIENGTILVRAGRIAAVGATDAVPVPDGTEVIDVTGRHITPGLVDAGAQVGVATRDQNEEGEEVTPAADILDALDPADPRFARLARSGVTTVQVTPGNRNVIGGLGAVLKTRGDTLEEMLVKRASTLRLVMGSEPSSGNRAIRGGTPRGLFYRRPTTRMGVIWATRKAFADAQEYAERTVDPNDPRPDDPGMERLVEALNGQLVVCTVARSEQDIRTALRIAEEYGYQTVIEEPLDAWKVADELAAAGTTVLYGAPSATRLQGGGGRDGGSIRWHTLNVLAGKGVPFAVMTGTNNAALPLAQEALFAVRHGLDPQAALRAVTAVPARVLGVEDRVGTLEAGKDADLVVWSGNPFSPLSRPESVYIGGERVDSQR